MLFIGVEFDIGSSKMYIIAYVSKSYFSFIFQKRLTSAAKKAITKLPTRTLSKKVTHYSVEYVIFQ